jgi:hypothetical protein
MLLLFGGKAGAQDFSELYGGVRFYYNIIDATNNYVEVTNANGGGEISTGSYTWSSYTYNPFTIPSSVTHNGTTYTVKKIGDYAFYYCTGGNGPITLPSTLTEIGNYAFSYCQSMTGTLTIPNNVTSIGDYAFDQCKISGTLYLPSGIITLGKAPFRASSLTSYVSYNNRFSVIDSVIYKKNDAGIPVSLVECLKLKKRLPSIPATVTSIEGGAFSYCQFLPSRSFTIPNTITAIGDDAFNVTSCLVTPLVIPEGVTTIGNTAFYNSGISGAITIPSTLTTMGGAPFCTDNGRTGIDGITSFSVTQPNTHFSVIDNVLYGLDDSGNPVSLIESTCNKSNTLQIPATVTTIKNYACYNVPWVRGVTIPSSVTSIEKSAFSKCGLLAQLTFEQSSQLTTIGDNAFEMAGLSGSVEIPSTVTSIGQNAFNSCSSITALTFAASSQLNTIGARAFYDCSGINNNLNIPNTVTEIGDLAFAQCGSIPGTVEIPSSVTKLGVAPFNKCYGITSFSVAEGSTNYCVVDSVIYNIDKTQLIECLPSKKTPTAIQSTVTSINQYSFADCNKLKGKLEIPTAVISIGDYAFYMDTKFYISIPDDCECSSIGQYALQYLKGVWFTNKTPNTFHFSESKYLGSTTFYIPEDDTASDPQSSNSIKGLYKTKIQYSSYSSNKNFRYYHLGMKCAQRNLASWPATQWGQTSVYCSTLYVNFPAIVPQGMTAFYGSEVPAGGGVVRLKSFDNTNSSGGVSISYNTSKTCIPTKCPAVLIGNSVPNYADIANGEAAVGDTIFEAYTEPYTETNVGILKGSLTDIPKSSVSGGTVYTLGIGNTSRTVGFYPYSGTTLGAHKAYLLKTTTMPAKGEGFDVTFDDDSETPTGISGIKNDEGTTDNAPYYNLEGMKVNKPAKGGIYIHNGKKIVIY